MTHLFKRVLGIYLKMSLLFQTGLCIRYDRGLDFFSTTWYFIVPYYSGRPEQTVKTQIRRRRTRSAASDLCLLCLHRPVCPTVVVFIASDRGNDVSGQIAQKRGLIWAFAARERRDCGPFYHVAHYRKKKKTLSMQGKNFSRRHFEIVFSYFPENRI